MSLYNELNENWKFVSSRDLFRLLSSEDDKFRFINIKTCELWVCSAGHFHIFNHRLQQCRKNMEQAKYIEIKKKLNFKPNILAALLVVAADVFLLKLSWQLLQSNNFFLALASQFILSFVFFHNFALLHEAGHGNISKKQWINDVFGFYASVFCCMPFKPWVYIHREHHIHAGDAQKDPTASNLLLWRRRGYVPFLISFTWNSWLPLGAAAQHLVFLSYPIKIYRKERSKFLSCLLSVVFLVVTYACLCLFSPAVMHPKNYAVAVVLYLFLEELVNLPHHSDLFFPNRERTPIWEQWQVSRSCYYPKPVSELLLLNFNFHAEHHLYPSLPWWRLRSARDIVKKAVGVDYIESAGIEWNIKNRTRDINNVLGV